MMPPRRYLAYTGVIVVLLLVNLVRWWQHGTGGPSAAQDTVLTAQDFRLRANVPMPAAVRRDLFASSTAAARPAAAPVVRAPRVAPTVRRVEPPAPVAETQAAALGRLRLLGVVFRGGRGQAYLALERDKAMAYAGENVFGQFTVDRVTVDAVQLRDLKNNTIRRIPVSGK